MTQALSVASRPGVFADAEQTLNASVASLRKAFATYRLHRRTLSELRRLSQRQLDDLGFADVDLATIARAAVQRG